jgi:hypothetical protein
MKQNYCTENTVANDRMPQPLDDLSDYTSRVQIGKMKKPGLFDLRMRLEVRRKHPELEAFLPHKKQGGHSKDQVRPETLERNGTAILMFRERRYFFTKSSDYQGSFGSLFCGELSLEIMQTKQPALHL